VPRVRVAKAFRRHVDCPDEAVEGGSVRAALDAYFGLHPAVQSYVLDEHGGVRKHVVIFIGDDQMLDRSTLTDPVAETDIIHIFQALSGG
jgi:sulfur-carrier protein